MVILQADCEGNLALGQVVWGLGGAGGVVFAPSPALSASNQTSFVQRRVMSCFLQRRNDAGPS